MQCGTPRGTISQLRPVNCDQSIAIQSETLSRWRVVGVEDVPPVKREFLSPMLALIQPAHGQVRSPMGHRLEPGAILRRRLCIALEDARLTLGIDGVELELVLAAVGGARGQRVLGEAGHLPSSL